MTKTDQTPSISHHSFNQKSKSVTKSASHPGPNEMEMERSMKDGETLTEGCIQSLKCIQCGSGPMMCVAVLQHKFRGYFTTF